MGTELEEIKDIIILPSDQTRMKTVEEVLNISPERHTMMTWFIDEICETGGTKAEGIEKIAKNMFFTDTEKVFMGFLLCKKYASMAPSPVREVLMEYIS